MAIDNDYRGQKAALWIFGLVLLVKTLMSIGSIVNGRNTLMTADAVPLASYPAGAAQTVVALFAIFALAHLVLAILGAIALVRYRGAVPFAYGMLLAELVSRRLLLRFVPIERTFTPPGFYVNSALLALLAIGFALSLWKRR